MRIDVELDTAGVRRVLSALGARAQNLAPAFREIGANVVADAQLRFRDSRDPYGVAWKPLTQATREARARRAAGKNAMRKDGRFKAAALRRFVGAYNTAKPLLDTGRLRNSITYRLLGASGVEVGSNVAYAALHQFGGQAGRGKKVTIPARPFLATRERGLPREYGEIIRDALARHFAAAATGGGGGAGS